MIYYTPAIKIYPMYGEIPLSESSSQRELPHRMHSFYGAIGENQRRWKEQKHTLLHPHEMPHVSQTLEQNMKQVFAEYLDPTYPRVIVARTVLQDNAFRLEQPFYNYGWEYRHPDSVTPEER